MWGGAWLLAALCSCSAQLAMPPEDTRSCTWSESHGMKGVFCSNLNLKEVPPRLSSSVEVMDLSSNRIRTLTDTSLSRYTYLRYLYLNDNLLIKVEEDAFTPLELLETVDLSENALHQVPPSLIGLPVLRRLYFADNVLLGLTDTIGFEEPPPDSQLHFLSLANCGLTSLPPLDGFRKLHTLNVSGNSLTNMTVGQVAPLCRLEVLDLTANKGLFSQGDQFCDCALLAEWLQESGVQLARGYRLNCAEHSSNYVPGERPVECMQQGEGVMTLARQQRASCRGQLVTLEQTAKTRKAWTTAGICAGVVVGVALLAVVLWLHCRRRRRGRIAQKQQDDLRISYNHNHNHNHKPLLTDTAADGERPARDVEELAAPA